MSLYRFYRLDEADSVNISSIADVNHPRVQQILKFLKTYKISSYSIHPDTHVVDVHQTVNLNGFKQQQLPIQFGVVEGDLLCHNVAVTTLKGFPTEVHGHWSLVNAKKLHSLQYGPILVKDFVSFEGTAVSDLRWVPPTIEGSLDLANMTTLRTLAGINKFVKRLDGPVYLGNTVQHITGDITGLVAIRGITEVHWDNTINEDINTAFGIVNKFIKQGTRASMECANALDDAGLDRFL
jgi:hypothetical protein